MKKLIYKTKHRASRRGSSIFLPVHRHSYNPTTPLYILYIALAGVSQIIGSARDANDYQKNKRRNIPVGKIKLISSILAAMSAVVSAIKAIISINKR